jgi:hypothetical protein
VSDAENKSWYRFRDAMSASIRLNRQDKKQEALRVLDDAIQMAISENEKRWILTLAHHAANVARFSGDLDLVKHYYQQSLSFNPENPRALLGLANVSRSQGHPELAKSYAVRCYEALAKDAAPSLLELLLNKWPDVLSSKKDSDSA